LELEDDICVEAHLGKGNAHLLVIPFFSSRDRSRWVMTKKVPTAIGMAFSPSATAEKEDAEHPTSRLTDFRKTLLSRKALGD
jgi:hypothetical protein